MLVLFINERFQVRSYILGGLARMGEEVLESLLRFKESCLEILKLLFESEVVFGQKGVMLDFPI